jgi:hypothetical protein
MAGWIAIDYRASETNLPASVPAARQRWREIKRRWRDETETRAERVALFDDRWLVGRLGDCAAGAADL